MNRGTISSSPSPSPFTTPTTTTPSKKRQLDTSIFSSSPSSSSPSSSSSSSSSSSKKQKTTQTNLSTPTTKKPNKDPVTKSSIFKNVTVLILPGEDNTLAVRRQLLNNLILEHSGTYQLNYSNTVTHIITTTTIAWVLSVIKLQKLPQNVFVVGPDWISHSIKQSKRLPETPYICRHIPDKIETDNPQSKLDRNSNNDSDSDASTVIYSDYEEWPTYDDGTPQRVRVAHEITSSSPKVFNTPKTLATPGKNLWYQDKFKCMHSNPHPSAKKSKKGKSKSKSKSNYSDSEEDYVHSDMEDHGGNTNEDDDEEENNDESTKNNDDNCCVANEYIINCFKALMDRRKYENHPARDFKVRNYQMVIGYLQKYKQPIESGEQLKNVRGFGDHAIKRINEILRTGTLSELKYLPESYQVCKLLTTIHGVGTKVALDWYNQGIRTIEDVRARYNSLTKDQKIGIKYHSDFQVKIPRKEIEAINDYITTQAKSIDTRLTTHLMGSYRRGATSCSDIDMIITHPSPQEFQFALTDITTKLKQTQFLIDDLSPTQGSSNDHPLYKGVCRLPDSRYARRIDILFVPPSELGAAFLHFTGNAAYNRSIRRLAGLKGMRLNQRGLFEVVGRSGKIKIVGKKLASQTEKEILEILGVPYVPPEERWVGVE